MAHKLLLRSNKLRELKSLERSKLLQLLFNGNQVAAMHDFCVNPLAASQNNGTQRAQIYLGRLEEIDGIMEEPSLAFGGGDI